MIPSDPCSVLDALTSSFPVVLTELPRSNGIYALHDHLGCIRYIGVTKEKEKGFSGRVGQRHVTGSEERSHKFSQAYNTGRMWRTREVHTLQVPSDSKSAKKLRTLFIRRHCRATFVTVENPGRHPSAFFAALTELEALVQAAAPPVMRTWEGKRFQVMEEPGQLVDALLDELDWSDEQRAALIRQAALFASLRAAP